MLTAQIITHARFDADSDEEHADFDVSRFDAVSIEAEVLSGTWSAAVLTAQDSVTGRVWDTDADLDTVTAANPILRNVDVSGRARLRLLLTTKNGGALILRLTLVGKVEA